MKHKIKFSALALGLCSISSNAYAVESNGFEISANTAIVSDYVFRGISQSDENFAIQGGFDVGHESGLYTGVWASSVDFNDSEKPALKLIFTQDTAVKQMVFHMT